MGGMAWRGRDRGVRHKLIALVRQAFHTKHKMQKFENTKIPIYKNTKYMREWGGGGEREAGLEV